MGPTWSRIALICLMLALPAAAQDSVSVLEEQTSARIVTVRVRIDPTAAAAPGACTEIALDDLDVRLRGEPRTAADGVVLERDRRPALHAMLIDTSGSVYDRLEVIRSSVRSYVDRLRPGLDEGMIIAFDSDPHLASAPTEDKDRLARAVEGLVMGGGTAMNDALILAAREFEQTDRRPVIVLLTDGFDTSSFYENQHVLDALARIPDLIVFVIGIDLPLIGTGSPSANTSGRRLLGQISARTQGRFIELLQGSKLERTYFRIRDMLDAEAILTVPDPRPDEPPGELTVRLDSDYCKVRVYKPRMRDRGADDGWTAMAAPVGSDVRVPIAPPKRYFQDGWFVTYLDPQGGCPPIDPQQWAWYADVAPGFLSACALDISMNRGALYGVFSINWQTWNTWLKLRNRRIEAVLPDPADLPTHPAALLDELASHALSVADDPVETDSRQFPEERHGRPHDDHPGLMSGEMILQVRDGLAAALYRESPYRAWAEERIRERIDAEFDLLLDRYRPIAPGLQDDALRAIVAQTEEGAALVARREFPYPADVRSALYAWLGDISAFDLFRAWEARRLDAAIARGATDDEHERFRDEWRAIRRVLGIASYNRSLAIVHPVRDDDGGRIGTWRVMLPRPSWYLPRIKSWDKHVEYSRIPLDIVPDEPFGYDVVVELLDERPELGNLRVGEIRYALTAKGVRRAPERAYRNFRVWVEMLPEDPTEDGGVMVSAEYAWVGKPGERIRQYVRVEDLHAFAGPEPYAGLSSTAID